MEWIYDADDYGYFDGNADSYGLFDGLFDWF